MRDLLVITPTRAGDDTSARPGRVREMISAARRLSGAQTDICLAVDDDDFARYGPVIAAFAGDRQVWWTSGPRDTLTGWTNKVAKRHRGKYRAYASFGDDHVVETEDWDVKFLAALDRIGGTGIVYGDDKLMGENLCTAPVVSSDIVTALGWMLEPSLEHMCVDCVLMDIGRGADCLAYVPEVITRHVHWCNNGAVMDATYAAAEAVKEADRARYAIWQRDRMAGDIGKVRALIERKAADAAV